MLKISEAASLAMHALAYIAAEERKGRYISTKDISEDLGVSEAHLSKVFQRLVKTGLVDGQRGPRGGVRLALLPSEITLMHIYESIDGNLSFTNCLLRTPVCKPPNCIMRGIVESVNNQVTDHFENTTLADLAELGIISARQEVAV